MRFIEHPSANYAPRTWHNAINADLTVAFAIDFSTAGEKLTRQIATSKYGKYIPIDFRTSVKESAKEFVRIINKECVHVLNVAGNSAFTMVNHHWSQFDTSLYVYKCLKNSNVATILSGGQTGADWAAIVAAEVLGIPWEATLPKGFKQRNNLGQDHYNTVKELEARLKKDVKELKLNLR